MGKSNEKGEERDLTDIESFKTDPWANAEKAPLDILDKIVYPDLKGMEVMLINPNCYYRKKTLRFRPWLYSHCNATLFN